MIDQLDAIATPRLRLRAARAHAFAVEHKGEVVGRVAFRSTGRAPEVGVWISPRHRGQGFATEALKAALGWAKSDWGRRYVIAGHRVDDRNAARVLIKAGFLYTGVVEERPTAFGGPPAPMRMMVWLA
jgi:RimJ/RimL family protein N-acetyltransferase